MTRPAVHALLFLVGLVGGCGDGARSDADASASGESSGETGSTGAESDSLGTITHSGDGDATTGDGDATTGDGDGDGDGDAEPEIVWEETDALPLYLDVSDTHLYWTDSLSDGVRRRSWTNGAVEHFGDEFTGRAVALALLGDDVYWGATGTGVPNLIRYSPDNGSGEIVAELPALPIGNAADGNDLIAATNDWGVYRYPGGQAPHSEIALNAVQVGPPCSTPNGAAWLRGDGGGEISLLRATATSFEVLATVMVGARDCVSDGPIYWGLATGMAVTDEVGATEVYTLPEVWWATSLALGPTKVYFTDMSDTIWSMRRDDQTLQALTVRDSEVRDMVFYDGRIYWSELSPGRIWSLQVE